MRKGNAARVYNLVLSHCPPKLEEVLKTLVAWESMYRDQDSMEVIGMVHNVCHKHDESKQGKIAYVESDLKLFTMY